MTNATADGFRDWFDTIDHNILCEILANTFKIEANILELLSKCLETWTADSNHKTFKSKHGIPQGPISSPFLADLYLFYVDTEIKKLNKPVIACCASGMRSSQATSILKQNGIEAMNGGGWSGLQNKL